MSPPRSANLPSIVIALVALCPPFTFADVCGVVSTQSRIVGGDTAGPTLYPWYVALTTSVRGTVSVACGGSLITPSHVLTAAHCYADSPKSSRTKMYTLIYRLSNRCKPRGVLGSPQAKSVFIHEQYKADLLENDIALITLDSKTSLTPVCLPPSKTSFSPVAEVIGFGSLDPKSLGVRARYPCSIQRVELPVLTMKQCQATKLAQVIRGMKGIVCAGKTEGGIDSCDGDSGGPLQSSDNNGVYTIRGVVSFGYGCARKSLPGVYTDVAYYRDWILSKIGRNPGLPSAPPSSPQRPPTVKPSKKPPTRPPFFSFPIPSWLNNTFNSIWNFATRPTKDQS